MRSLESADAVPKVSSHAPQRTLGGLAARPLNLQGTAIDLAKDFGGFVGRPQFEVDVLAAFYPYREVPVFR